MTRFYLKLIIPIAVVCLIFMLITRAIGTTQPPNPALRGFVEGCVDKPQPCWYGIVPGVTTLETVHETLTKMDYSVTSEEFGCCGNPMKFLQANSKIESDCQLLMETFPVNSEASDPNQKVQIIFEFELVDCKDLTLGDVFLAIPNPIVAYSCSNMSGSAEITFGGGFWLNLNPYSFTSITRVNDPIHSISVSLFSDDLKSRNHKLDSLWYGFMPQWKLRHIIYEKYCRYG